MVRDPATQHWPSTTHQGILIRPRMASVIMDGNIWCAPHELRPIVFEGIALARHRPALPPQYPPHLADGIRALCRELGGTRLLAVLAGGGGRFSLQSSDCSGPRDTVSFPSTAEAKRAHSMG